MNPILPCTRFLYKNALKPFLFLKDPEIVHTRMVRIGKIIGSNIFTRKFLSLLYYRKHPTLEQNIFGLDFKLPIGLAAGFDYEGRLTQILPSIGFGFGTVGTLTYLPYEGNKGPMLGRLPRSKSLMVNKGFKNPGIEKTLNNLKGKQFQYPVGISIGKTNTISHKTQKDGIDDIISSFTISEKSSVPFAYYELNISCPNLVGKIEFYEPTHLEELLSTVDKLQVKKPVFIKMPISKTDNEIISMLDVIVRFPFVKAVIIGNLQRDRENPNLIPEELAKFPIGNFSGLPCQSRSDELIKLVYRNYGKKIKIIGCGGVFTTEDAYRKIRLGASLVQMITGMIFEGPQLISEINHGLSVLIKKDGFSNISEAIGVDNFNS